MTISALTLRQPWASLIAEGIKTIETRSWAAPKELIGQRIAIHAAMSAPPMHWHHDADQDVPATVDLACMSKYWEWSENLLDPVSGGSYRWVGPLGAIVATVRLVDCVPMFQFLSRGPGDHPEPSFVPYPGDGKPPIPLLRINSDRSILATHLPGGVVTDVTDQIQYGTFEPGRWAWLLDDIAPTTERCPWCEGYGAEPTFDLDADCQVCDGARSCDPIPAKGRQKVWRWLA